jgi:hypothetical protein
MPLAASPDCEKKGKEKRVVSLASVPTLTVNRFSEFSPFVFELCLVTLPIRRNPPPMSTTKLTRTEPAIFRTPINMEPNRQWTTHESNEQYEKS